MEFRKNNPGAVQYGNFINYYQFNSAEERLKLLPPDVWLPSTTSTFERTTKSYLLLDVGCNSGNFTQLLYKNLENLLRTRCKDIQILGIDIDEGLIERAQEENMHPDNVSYRCVDIMDDATFQVVVKEFLNTHGSHEQQFDAVCCFSITMWIHLNHGDDGLRAFLTKLSHLSCLLIVEPQPWKCYQTAERRLKKAGEEFPLFLKLKWRSKVEQEIQSFMEEILGMKKIAECDPTKWKRRICFYR